MSREEWEVEQTLISLDDCGIVLPMDRSSSAWRRDYGQRQEHRNPFDGVIFGCVLGLFVWLPLIVWYVRTK